MARTQAIDAVITSLADTMEVVQTQAETIAVLTAQLFTRILLLLVAVSLLGTNPKPHPHPNPSPNPNPNPNPKQAIPLSHVPQGALGDHVPQAA